MQRTDVTETVAVRRSGISWEPLGSEERMVYGEVFITTIGQAQWVGDLAGMHEKRTPAAARAIRRVPP